MEPFLRQHVFRIKHIWGGILSICNLKGIRRNNIEGVRELLKDEYQRKRNTNSSKSSELFAESECSHSASGKSISAAALMSLLWGACARFVRNNEELEIIRDMCR